MIPEKGGMPTAWTKTVGAMNLVRAASHGDRYSIYPGRKGGRYTLQRASGEPIASFQAHWADFDFDGRLVACSGGHLCSAHIGVGSTPLIWSELASLAAERFSHLVAPEWAKRW